MSEVKWTSEQVAMFAQENEGREVRGYIPDRSGRLVEMTGCIETKHSGSFYEGIPSLTVAGIFLDPTTIVFLDGQPEAAPIAPGELSSFDSGKVYCGVRENRYKCTRPVGHPPTVHAAHVFNRECLRWPVYVSPAEVAIYKSDPPPASIKGIASQISGRTATEAREYFEHAFPTYRRIYEKHVAFAEAAGAPSVARELKVKVSTDQAMELCKKAIADFMAADSVFLGHVDELLRWAQGHTDRDLVRDRVCRALGPLLRERMGRKLG